MTWTLEITPRIEPKPSPAQKPVLRFHLGIHRLDNLGIKTVTAGSTAASHAPITLFPEPTQEGADSPPARNSPKDPPGRDEPRCPPDPLRPVFWTAR